LIYIICSDVLNLKKYLSFLEADNVEHTILTWDKLNFPINGFFVIVEANLEANHISLIKTLAANKAQILCLSKPGIKLFDNMNNVLFLPISIDIPTLQSVIYWTIYNNTAAECFKTLRALFFEKKYQIFFIDNKGTIIYSLPENDSILGCKGKYFQGKRFKDVFGISLDNVSNAENAKNQGIYNLSTTKKQIKINLFKLLYDSKRIPGAPKGTYSILFLVQYDPNNSQDLSSDFSLSEANEPSLQIKLKTMELLITNEIHHKQTQKLRDAFAQLSSRNKQILEELSLASDLQKSLLPRKFPTGIPLNFTHKYLPYMYIGGDFFDVIQIEKNLIGIIIADASGHGVSAAFITAMFKSTVNHYKDLHSEPSKLMHALNLEFAETIHTEHYITAFYAVLDLEKMKCTYCNAGHPKQLLVRKGGESQELTTDGFFIGMFENTEYAQKEVDLFSGDRLVFFTDGILEITNSKQELFGRANVRKTIIDNRHLDIEAVSNVLMSNLVMYMDDINFQDDITILITEVKNSL